ncbi:MAG TPA: DUF1778 domain-containing protein [Candidatus Kapabacteria bacterium]
MNPARIRSEVHRHSGRGSLFANVSRDQTALIERAAEEKGVTVAEFVAMNLEKAALRAIEDEKLIRLNVKESRAFAKALFRDPPDNPTLANAAQKYLQLLRR